MRQLVKLGNIFATKTVILMNFRFFFKLNKTCIFIFVTDVLGNYKQVLCKKMKIKNDKNNKLLCTVVKRKKWMEVWTGLNDSDLYLTITETEFLDKKISSWLVPKSKEKKLENGCLSVGWVGEWKIKFFNDLSFQK